ncbi:ribonuclease R [Erysipelotrichaceae bacterium OttesenSCG-928-M19]|nr:ribonuclease R [Erysipelotrichaceae bacterium OttesenSCG-928-M19]
MLKDKILEILNNNHYSPLTYQEIAQIILNSNDDYDLNEIYKVLVTLENEYEIIRVKNDKLQSISKMGLLKGVLDIKKAGFGFVKTNDFDIYISKDHLNGAINKDYVLVKLDKSIQGLNKEGTIERVLKHGYNLIVGNIIVKKGKLFVKPDESSLNFLIRIKDKYSLGASEGHKVLCYISDVDTKNDIKYGKIKTIIGHINDVGMDILAIVYKYGFDPNFSKEALREAKQVSESAVELGKRRDLRSLLTFTIDGADAKDLDDAVSLELNEKNNYLLYVSIADVSYYVAEKTFLDKEAYARGTSVYLANRVVPMLPPQLSNGICSLLPEVDRLTQTCKMEFDQAGKLVDYEIFESVINSDFRLTYDEVNQILDGNQKLSNQYNEIVAVLFKMHELSLKLRAQKEKRGMLDFEIAEPKIIVNSKGKAIDVVVRKRGESERIIEDFMIIANETVAQHIYWLDLPFLYRVHEKPNPDKIRDFLSFASIFKLKLKGNLDNITSKDIQKLLNDINAQEDNSFLDRLLLRSMAKAKYQSDCLGHFGLASNYYTHFTSPIRRYPDLIVHRLLRKYLYNDTSKLDISKLTDSLLKIGEKTSQKERDAIDAEREANDLKMAEYMADHLKEIYEARIASVTSFGFFVELENTVEGLVHISTLMDDHYIYDSKYHLLMGQRTKQQYKLGQKVKVIVDKVSISDRNIDFKIVKEEGSK